MRSRTTTTELNNIYAMDSTHIFEIKNKKYKLSHIFPVHDTPLTISKKMSWKKEKNTVEENLIPTIILASH